MKLKEAKAIIDSEHPDWTSSEKIKAIKELRQLDRDTTPEKPQTPDKPMTVKDAWIFVAFAAVGMSVIGTVVWGSSEPEWFQVLYVGLLIYAIVLLVKAYKERKRQRDVNASQSMPN